MSQFNVKEFIEKYYLHNRVWVCKDITEVAHAIKDVFNDGTIWTADSNEDVLSWVVPPAWEVEYARLFNSKGEVLIDYENHPLHVIQYGGSFSGELSFDELKTHLHYDTNAPKGIPYIYVKQYDHQRDGDWGLALSYEQYQTLDPNERYTVEIKTKFYDSKACVYDLHIEGQRKETVVFAAHTCHPGQVADGLGCVALLMELFLWIKTLKNTLYSYRLIIGPEYLGAAVFLAKANKIENLKYGYFLDMMFHNQPIEYSQSFEGDTLVDYVTASVLKEKGIATKIHDFRQLYGNDEMFYDGADYEIPFIGLGRPTYPEYHMDLDNLDAFIDERYLESKEVVRSIVEMFEKDKIIKRNYKGPLYLSKHNMYIPTKKYPDAVLAQQKLQRAMDGKRSLLEIAKKYDLDINFCYDFAQQLLENNVAQEVTSQECLSYLGVTEKVV